MSRRGFTLLEVLVATSIMAIAVVGLLSALSSSLSNANRLTDHDKAALAARRKMDELLLASRLPRMQVMEGPLDPVADGLEGGWRAEVFPFEAAPNVGPGMVVFDRVECEIWWTRAGQRKSFALEAYKANVLGPGGQ
jgi:general secretion pathway protein I